MKTSNIWDEINKKASEIRGFFIDSIFFEYYLEVMLSSTILASTLRPSSLEALSSLVAP